MINKYFRKATFEERQYILKEYKKMQKEKMRNTMFFFFTLITLLFFAIIAGLDGEYAWENFTYILALADFCVFGIFVRLFSKTQKAVVDIRRDQFLIAPAKVFSTENSKDKISLSCWFSLDDQNRDITYTAINPLEVEGYKVGKMVYLVAPYNAEPIYAEKYDAILKK